MNIRLEKSSETLWRNSEKHLWYSVLYIHSCSFLSPYNLSIRVHRRIPCKMHLQSQTHTASALEVQYLLFSPSCTARKWKSTLTTLPTSKPTCTTQQEPLYSSDPPHHHHHHHLLPQPPSPSLVWIIHGAPATCFYVYMWGRAGRAHTHTRTHTQSTQESSQRAWPLRPDPAQVWHTHTHTHTHTHVRTKHTWAHTQALTSTVRP